MANIFCRQKVDVEALQTELLPKEEIQVESLKEKQKIVMEICEKAIKELS